LTLGSPGSVVAVSSVKAFSEKALQPKLKGPGQLTATRGWVPAGERQGRPRDGSGKGSAPIAPRSSGPRRRNASLTSGGIGAQV
jgi:hypothetical protein